MVVKRIRSSINAPRGLTNREKIIFKDNGGNKLYAKKGVTTGCQFSAKNAEGRYVDEQGIRVLMRRWNNQRR
jgi:hypothetical protein